MTTYKCKKCPAKSNGQPQYHPGMWACPKEVAYDPGKTTRYDERHRQARELMKEPAPAAPGAAPAPGASPPVPQGSPPPKPGAGSPASLQRLEFGAQVAETARRDASQKQAETDWLLPADSSQTFFETIRNGFRMFAHWLDDLLDAKKTEEGEIKDSVFELNSHDISAARGGFGQRLATKAVKALGARTMEEGIATVDTLAFVLMFASMFLIMVGHFWRVAEQSPRLKKFREKNEARKLEKEKAIAAKRLSDEQKRRAVDTTAKPAAGAA